MQVCVANIVLFQDNIMVFSRFFLDEAWVGRAWLLTIIKWPDYARIGTEERMCTLFYLIVLK